MMDAVSGTNTNSGKHVLTALTLSLLEDTGWCVCLQGRSKVDSLPQSCTLHLFVCWQCCMLAPGAPIFHVHYHCILPANVDVLGEVSLAECPALFWLAMAFVGCWIGKQAQHQSVQVQCGLQASRLQPMGLQSWLQFCNGVMPQPCSKCFKYAKQSDVRRECPDGSSYLHL